MTPGFWRRKFVKPGLFGPAHLHRDENYIDYELKYLERMSILLDIWWIIVGILFLLNLISGKKDYVGSEIHQG
jgi:lipopolysaccharide/colanic/teichoic acid biosynthesis glycosyltransferase